VAKCISCMTREGDPKNGGLCYVCAPAMRIVLHGLRTYRRWRTR
jgi:hypothetical protein